MKQPEVGEWWFSRDMADRVFIVGTRSDGKRMFENTHGIILPDLNVLGDWHHEPDCTGWSWEPEVFPKYVVPAMGLFGSIGDGYFIRRKSKTAYEYVHANRIEASCCLWGSAESEAIKSGSWKYVSSEHARDLIQPQKPDPENVLVNCGQCGEFFGHGHKCEKPSGIEAIVCRDITERQKLGIAKYGKTVADNPLSVREWLEHAYQECLDQAVYLRRAMEELK